MPLIPPGLLLDAYRHGYFPMGTEGVDDPEVSWFEPKKRGLLPLDAFHVPHGLRRALKRGEYEIRFDTAFPEVMRACAERAETWINTTIFESYCELHRLNHAHSVEAWHAGKLVGGLYGVHLGGAFFGESMFHRRTDASKVALVALVERLRARGFSLLDTQWVTPHLLQFGAIEISQARYRRMLRDALAVECAF